jgi:hypothetical protein
MSNQLHRRNLSNDGGFDAAVAQAVGQSAASGTLAPSRTSSSSNNKMNSSSNGDVESPALLPPRGRSWNNETNGIANGSNVVASSNATAPPVTITKNNGVALTGAGWKAFSTCMNYSFCSVSMIIVNKSLASRYVSTSGFFSSDELNSRYCIGGKMRHASKGNANS